METSRNIFSQNFQIRSYELDAQKKASLQTLSCFLQETAVRHVRSFDIGVSSLLEKGLGWVLSRIKIKINRYPDWGEDIEVQTWSPGFDKLYAHREFRILDDNNQVLGLATSLWVVMNIDNGRPESIYSVLKDFKKIHNERALTDSLKKLPKIDEPDFCQKIEVKYSDLDFYRHVSNIKYIDWIMESVPIDIRESHIIDTIEINYLLSVSYGDVVVSEIKKLDEERISFMHRLSKETDKDPILRAKTSWIEKNE